MEKEDKSIMNRDITFVLTSCNRFDLLRDTLDSFLKCNKYPITNWIITEDSGDFDMYNRICKYYSHIFQEKNIIFHKNKPRKGISVIDEAYSLVKTPYIMHCEDDWHFHNENKIDFIKNSIILLEEDPNILQVHIRDKNTLVGQKVENTIHKTKNNVKYRYMKRWGGWNGFSLNPGVRRLSDYKLAAPFSQFLQPATKKHSSWVLTEKTIAEFYTKKGYRGVHLEDFCFHTGGGKRVI